jgi:hypothetical protein
MSRHQVRKAVGVPFWLVTYSCTRWLGELSRILHPTLPLIVPAPHLPNPRPSTPTE